MNFAQFVCCKIWTRPLLDAEMSKRQPLLRFFTAAAEDDWTVQLFVEEGDGGGDWGERVPAPVPAGRHPPEPAGRQTERLLLQLDKTGISQNGNSVYLAKKYKKKQTKKNMPTSCNIFQLPAFPHRSLRSKHPE